MTCPCCHKPKTHEDFYWGRTHGNKVFSDCKDCLKEARERKKQELQQKAATSYFNVDLFWRQFGYG